MDRKRRSRGGKHILLIVFLSVASVLASVFVSTSTNILSIAFFTGIACAFLSAALIFRVNGAIALVAVASAGLGYGLTRDFTAALSAMAYVPVSFMIAYGVLRHHTKVQVVVKAAVVAGLMFAMFAAAHVMLSVPVLTFERVMDYIVQENSLEEAINFVKASPAYAQLQITDVETSALIQYVMSILPGLFVSACLIFAYFTAGLTSVISRVVSNRETYFKSFRWQFKLSKPSGFFLIMAFVLMMFVPSSSEVLVTTLTNITIILSPGYFLYGLKVILNMFVSRRRFSVPLIYVCMTIIIAVSVVFSLLMMVIVCIGIYDNMLPRFGARDSARRR